MTQKNLRDVRLGETFRLDGEPTMVYKVTGLAEVNRDRVDAICLTTGMGIAPSFVLSGAEIVDVKD
jgi:hypothetical protein